MKFAVDLSKGVLGNADSTELWTEIISNIPDSVLLTPNVRILSVACGHCTEAVILAKRMLALGISKKRVRDSIWLIDKYKVFTNHAKLVYGFTNVITADFLEWKTDMKFDVIVGNPPYQGTNDKSEDRIQPKNHNLWTKFINKSFSELVSNNGYVSFVTPDSWMSPSNEIFKLFKMNQLLWVDLTCGKYFNVGSSFTAWGAQKTPVVKDTKIGSVSLNLKDFPYLPRGIESSLSIHQKVLNSKSPKIDCIGDITCHSSKPVVSKVATAEYVHPLHHTNAQTRYGSIKSAYQDKIKVIWTLSGNYIPKIDLGVLGFTEVNQAIIATNQTEANNIYSYMNSNLYRYIVTTAKWSGFLNGKVFSMLPKLDQTKSWTDEEIYKFFNLTDTEIEIIEDYIAK